MIRRWKRGPNTYNPLGLRRGTLWENYLSHRTFVLVARIHNKLVWKDITDERYFTSKE